MAFELGKRGLVAARQTPVPVIYDDVRLDAGFRLDLLVEKRVILEIKAVERLLPVHEAQVLTYLRLSGVQVGLLMNFNVTRLADGVRRFVNGGGRG